MIKTFRGNLGHQEVQTIRLSTVNGLTGYRIRKFEVIGETPGTTSQIATVFLNTVDHGAPAAATINFDSPTLLAVAQYESTTSASYNPQPIIIFDHVKFNQDIYISNFISSGTGAWVNYYLELEQVKLSVDEAAVATLKNMRGRE